MNALLRIDRRWIFLFVAVLVIGATRFPFKPKVVGSGTVKDVYEAVDKLEPREGRDRAVVLYSMDFDPGSAPELEPMSRAMIRHALRRGHRVIGMTHWPTGIELANRILSDTVQEFDLVVVRYERFKDEDEARKRQEEMEAPRKKLEEGEVTAKYVETALGAQAATLIEPGPAEAHVLKKEPAAAVSGDQASMRYLHRAAELALTRASLPQGEVGLQARDLYEKARTFHDNVAVLHPGVSQVILPQGSDLTWDEVLRGKLGQASKGDVVVAKMADGTYLTIEVLERQPTLVYGEDYCYLGMRAGQEIVMIAMGQSLYDAFATDLGGRPTRSLPMLKDVPTLRQLDYLVALAAGDTGEKWISYGQEKYNFPMSVGCTAVMAPDLYPYRQAKQIDGIVGGIRGAWEYEALTNVSGAGQEAVLPQTVAHLLIVFLILVCNIGYFASRGKG